MNASVARAPAGAERPSIPRPRLARLKAAGRWVACAGRDAALSGAVTGTVVAVAGAAALGTAPLWAPLAAGAAVGAVAVGASRLAEAALKPGGLSGAANRRAALRGCLDDAALVAGSLVGAGYAAKLAGRTMPTITKIALPALTEGGLQAVTETGKGVLDGKWGLRALGGRFIGGAVTGAAGSLVGQGIGHVLAGRLRGVAAQAKWRTPRMVETPAGVRPVPLANAQPMAGRPGLSELKLPNGVRAIVSDDFWPVLQERPELLVDVRIARESFGRLKGTMKLFPSEWRSVQMLDGSSVEVKSFLSGSEADVIGIRYPGPSGKFEDGASYALKFKKAQPWYHSSPADKLLIDHSIMQSKEYRILNEEGFHIVKTLLVITDSKSSNDIVGALDRRVSGLNNDLTIMRLHEGQKISIQDYEKNYSKKILEALQQTLNKIPEAEGHTIDLEGKNMTVDQKSESVSVSSFDLTIGRYNDIELDDPVYNSWSPRVRK